MISPRKPQRTCIACRRKGDQDTFFRVSRALGGRFMLLKGQAANGRSAYVCMTSECVTGALSKERLNRALKHKLAAEEREGIEKDLEWEVQQQRKAI